MRRRQAGHVLLVALFVIVVTSAAGAMLAGAIGHRMWLLRQEARDLHLTTLADAAVAKAVAELSVGQGYRGTRGAVSFGDGTISIVARRQGTGAEVELRVTCAGGRRAARVEVTLHSPAGHQLAADRFRALMGSSSGPAIHRSLAASKRTRYHALRDDPVPAIGRLLAPYLQSTP